MKKIFLICAAALCMSAAQSQTWLLINKQAPEYGEYDLDSIVTKTQGRNDIPSSFTVWVRMPIWAQRQDYYEITVHCFTHRITVQDSQGQWRNGQDRLDPGAAWWRVRNIGCGHAR